MKEEQIIKVLRRNNELIVVNMKTCQKLIITDKKMLNSTDEEIIRSLNGIKAFSVNCKA